MTIFQTFSFILGEIIYNLSFGIIRQLLHQIFSCIVKDLITQYIFSAVSNCSYQTNSLSRSIFYITEQKRRSLGAKIEHQWDVAIQ